MRPLRLPRVVRCHRALRPFRHTVDGRRPQRPLHRGPLGRRPAQRPPCDPRSPPREDRHPRHRTVHRPSPRCGGGPGIDRKKGGGPRRGSPHSVSGPGPRMQLHRCRGRIALVRLLHLPGRGGLPPDSRIPGHGQTRVRPEPRHRRAQEHGRPARQDNPPQIRCNTKRVICTQVPDHRLQQDGTVPAGTGQECREDDT